MTRPRIAADMTAGRQRSLRLAADRGEVSRGVLCVHRPMGGSLSLRPGNSSQLSHRQEGRGRQQEGNDGVQRPQAEPDPMNSRQGSTPQIR